MERLGFHLPRQIHSLTSQNQLLALGGLAAPWTLYITPASRNGEFLTSYNMQMALTHSWTELPIPQHLLITPEGSANRVSANVYHIRGMFSRLLRP